MKNLQINPDTHGKLMLLGAQLAERTDRGFDSAIEDPEIRKAVDWERESLIYSGSLVDFTEEITI